MHINRVPVRTGSAGQCVCLALKMPADQEGGRGGEGSSSSSSSTSPRKHFKGTVLISPSTSPSAAYEFDAEVRRQSVR